MPLKTQHDEAPNLNLTSMIDVLFLLIIFFMVATKFDQLERNIDVAVPQVSQDTDGSTPPQPLIVAVQAEGAIFFDGQSVTPEELTTRLAATRTPLGDPTVVIRGDAKCEFQHVAEALAACKRAGISELGVTVRIAGVGSTTR